MRDFTGIAFQQETDPVRRKSLGDIDYFLRDLSRGISRIQNGQVPDGSGKALGVDLSVLKDYLYLPGRAGGQIANAIDTNPGVTFNSVGTGLVNNGDVGNPLVRFSAASTGLFDLRPYQFDATIEAILTNSAGVGTSLNLLSADGTGALRLTSVASRTFFQVGKKQSSGNVANANLTFGATGARVASGLAYEYQTVTIGNSGTTLADGTAVTANTTKVGINVNPTDYAGGTWNDSLVVTPRGGTTAPAISAVPAASANAVGFALRTTPGGSTPNQTLGAILATLENSSANASYGSVGLYESGSKRANYTLTTNGVIASPTISNGSDLLLLRLSSAAVWSDNATKATSTYFEFGDVQSAHGDNNKGYSLIARSGGSALDRLGVCATSVVVGPTSSGALLAPSSSRIFSWVNSTPAVVGYFDSAGAFALDTVNGGSPTILEANSGSDVFLNITDQANAANTCAFQMNSLSGSTTLNFPNTGTVTTTTAAQNLTNKSINSATAVNLINQSGDIGASNLALGATNTGHYLITIYAMCTSNDLTAGALNVTIGWTDTNGAQTATVTATNGTFPLVLTAKGDAGGVVLLKRASGNITYATSHTGIFGTAQYALSIRVLSLGA